ncbi:MAG TPA: asparagine synthase (glutamine-hydrolyzing) [Nannocystis exedens]|nr:asparagine synthase (glutamine-hydrolyzing) [Nannocystis exedens]
MCGIVGAFALSEPLREGWLGPPLRALAHRGPDGEGRWVSADRRVALGHRRLAIIDRAGGAQPLANERGDLIAVVSGELYDYVKLHRELCGRGHRFRSKSDSELLLHLYAEYGVECIHHLRGEFAFLLWDKRQRLGIAGRDRFGIRPLVYARLGDAYCFASEGKALLAAGVPAAWDLEAVFAATQMQYAPADRTLFRGIHQLEPGELALISAGRLRIRRYWNLDYPQASELPAIDDEEAVQEVSAALREAVRIRLGSEVPIAFQLSGGLDSSAVVALAAAELGRPPICYTVAFDRPGYDERVLAEQTASYVGAELRVVEVSAAALAERLPQAIAHSEGLAINGHIAAKHLLSERIRADGIGVVLTGEGADEVFAGYAHLRCDLAGDRDDGGLAASNRASAGLMLPSGEGLDLSAVARAVGYVPTWMAAKATLGHRLRSLLSDDFVAELGDRDAYGISLADVELRRQLRGRNRVHQSLYLWTKSALATYILRTLGDGMEMAHSIEGRLPFLDHHLFAVARRLPIDLLIRGGVEKYVLRRAIGGRIPESIRQREKHPFLAPPLCLVDTVAIQAILRGSGAAIPDFIDRHRLRAAVERLPTLPKAERRVWDPALMLVASLCIQQQRYGC